MSDKVKLSIPIGTGHASAMFRLGLKELRELGNLHGSNIAQPTEMGLFGTKTPGEVAAARGVHGPTVENERDSESHLESRLRQAEDRAPEDREPKDLERE